MSAVFRPAPAALHVRSHKPQATRARVCVSASVRLLSMAVVDHAILPGTPVTMPDANSGNTASASLGIPPLVVSPTGTSTSSSQQQQQQQHQQQPVVGIPVATGYAVPGVGPPNQSIPNQPPAPGIPARLITAAQRDGSHSAAASALRQSIAEASARHALDAIEMTEEHLELFRTARYVRWFAVVDVFLVLAATLNSQLWPFSMLAVLPALGYRAAQKLHPQLIGAYLGFCVVNFIRYALEAALYRYTVSRIVLLIFLVAIELYITRFVYRFYTALRKLEPDELTQLQIMAQLHAGVFPSIIPTVTVVTGPVGAPGATTSHPRGTRGRRERSRASRSANVQRWTLDDGVQRNSATNV